MTQKEHLDSIKKHLARFQAQVKISTSSNEYDINNHAENVIIPILDAVLETNLKNANVTEGKNVEAIDLIDEEKRIAVQVTSTKNIEKIKRTLSKFINSRFKNKIDTLYVYILAEKQASYSQDALDKVIGNKIKLSVKEHILDATDIYRKLKDANDLETIERIEELLQYQFSDIYLNKRFTLSRFEQFKKDYTESCITNFSRINFFGLSVSTNKPREIELYLLFIYPKFTTSGTGRRYSLPPRTFRFITV